MLTPPAPSALRHPRHLSSPPASVFRRNAAQPHTTSSRSSPRPTDPEHLAFLLQGPLSAPHLLQIHARVFQVGAHQDSLVATRLIGRLPAHLATRVLGHLRDPSVFPFNAAVRVLSESGLSSSAFSVFRSLKRRSVLPNGFTFSFLLKACCRSADVGELHEVHTQIIKSGLDADSSVCNGLLLAYARGVGDVLAARKLFDVTPDKTNVFSWSCLITGLAHANRQEEALMLFLRMLDEGPRPEDDTMVGVLSACSKIKETEKWVSIFSKHSDIAYHSAHDSVDTILVYLYSKGGNIEKSRDIFDRVLRRCREGTSIVTWNAMISGCTQNGHPVQALDLFHQMVASSNPKPNHVTMVSMLSACAEVGDLNLGRWAHRYMEVERCRGILETNTILATAFIDMYCKCGGLEEAKYVFHALAKKDVISFNAMIMGLAMNGKGLEALALSHEMRQIGVRHNSGTFLGLLCACTHAGLISEGRALFADMSRQYSVTPKLEHFACYVDLLARAGHIEEVLEIIRTMPIEPNEQIWGALLCSCLVHSRVDAAQDAAKRLVDVDPENSAGYVMLSNAYAIDSRWSEVADLRGLMSVRGVRKRPGCSWISIKGVTHEFRVGCTHHPQIPRVYLLLDHLLKEMKLIGY